MKLGLCIAVGVLLLASQASAQNTVNPSANWNSSWGFSTPQEVTVRLLQADTIKKAEEGYYDSFGPAQVTMTNNYDQRQGYVEVNAGAGATIDAQNHVGDSIGQNTNVIGAINQSTTRIDIGGNNNSVTAISGAESTGCQDGSISIATVSSNGQEANAGSGSSSASGSAGGVQFSSGSSACN